MLRIYRSLEIKVRGKKAWAKLPLFTYYFAIVYSNSKINERMRHNDLN